MGIIEIILLIAGSGGVSGFITWLVTMKAQKKREEGYAQQETARGKQETVKAEFDLREFEKSIFREVSEMLKEQTDNLKKENEELREEVGQLRTANLLNSGKITELEKLVKDYKDICDTCQFRLEKKSKK
jgi:galactokinase